MIVPAPAAQVRQRGLDAVNLPDEVDLEIRPISSTVISSTVA